MRNQRSTAPKSPDVTESPERIRKQRRGASVRAGALPAHLVATDDFGYDAGDGHDFAAAGATHVAGAGTGAGAGTDKLREARHRLLAYQDHDPLTEALGSGPAAPPARVSREALLQVCKEQAEEHLARRLSGGSLSVAKYVKILNFALLVIGGQSRYCYNTQLTGIEPSLTNLIFPVCRIRRATKKARAPSAKLASSARRGSKINFSSDDESLEEVDEDDDGEAGAVQTLRNLKQVNAGVLLRANWALGVSFKTRHSPVWCRE